MKKISLLIFLGLLANQIFTMDVGQNQVTEKMRPQDYDEFFSLLSKPLQQFVNEDFKDKWTKEERADLVVDFTWTEPMKSFNSCISKKKDHAIYDNYKPQGITWFIHEHVNKDDPNQVLYLTMILNYIRSQDESQPDADIKSLLTYFQKNAINI